MSRTYRKLYNKPYRHCYKFQSFTQIKTNKAYNETRKVFYKAKPKGKIQNFREYLAYKADRKRMENLQYKLRPRTCPELIWDDKYTSVFIKESYL